MTSLKDVVKKIHKAYGLDNMIIKGDVVPKYKRLTTKCLGFGYALYGGLAYGRIHGFSGPSGSGKTMAALTMLGEYQKENPDKLCVYVDVEHALDLGFVAKMGNVDLDKLYYVDPNTLGGEAILDLILDLQEADDVGMIILDSFAGLISGRRMDESLEKDLGMKAHMAPSNSYFLQKMVQSVAKKNNIFIYINHVGTEKLPGNSGAIRYIESGGKALEYYASSKIRFAPRKFVKGDKTDLSSGEDADGFRISFVITKSKTSDVRRGGGFITYTYENGVDVVRDTLEIAIKLGKILQAGPYFTLIDVETGEVLTDKDGKELKFQGKSKLFNYLEENKEFMDEYIKKLSDNLNASTGSRGLLEKEELERILEEESQTDKS